VMSLYSQPAAKFSRNGVLKGDANDYSNRWI
jgi:hypothetical protein